MFLAIASTVSGAVYSTGALVVKLLIAELLYAGLCFLFLFLAERTWDSCDSFVERLGMGALSVGVFGVVVGFRPICSERIYGQGLALCLP